MSTIEFTIDGKKYRVPKGTTVYQAAKEAGIDLPIFCYQDRMPPFGACRVCLVEVEKNPKLQASCTLEALEGMVVNTASSKAVEGRKSILELLLINHPLDCPICDRGGECPLQENALHHGPGKSRFYEEKVHFKKPLPLGPVLMLDRERCIVCARCTRFGELVAKDNALQMIDRGYKTEVGTPGGTPVESKFIGNTIMICPVGALTSQVYRFRARPWDNHSTPSTCALCPVGCSLILDSRDGEIVRTRSCENKEVNDIWLCDKGWFGYEFTSHPARLKNPLIRKNGELHPATWEEALDVVAEAIIKYKPRGKLAALGGSPLTLEENFLFQKLMREVADSPHVDYRIGQPIFTLAEERISPGMRAPLQELENLDFFYLLGLDVTETFPIVWLRLSQAVNKGAEGVFIGYAKPENATGLHEVVLHPAGSEEKQLYLHLQIAIQKAREGKKGAFLVGSQYLSHKKRKHFLSLIQKAARECPGLTLNLLEGKGNSQGARFAGMHPELAPLGKKAPRVGKNVTEVVEAAYNDGWDFLYVAGGDLASCVHSSHWINARDKLGFLVVQDLFLTKTASSADIVLPGLSYVEKHGHFMNIEGRVSKLSPGKEIPSSLMQESEIFQAIGRRLSVKLSVDPEFNQWIENKKIILSDIQELSISEVSPQPLEKLIAIYEGKLFDQGVRMSFNKQLSQMVKPPFVRIHPHEVKKRGLADASRVAISYEGNSFEAPLKWDSGVAENTVMIPLGFDQIPVYELGDNPIHGFSVEVVPV